MSILNYKSTICLAVLHIQTQSTTVFTIIKIFGKTDLPGNNSYTLYVCICIIFKIKQNDCYESFDLLKK